MYVQPGSIAEELTIEAGDYLLEINGQNLNQQIHYTGQYLTNKPVFAQMLKSRNKKKFRQEHQTEIELYEAAVKFLKVKC